MKFTISHVLTILAALMLAVTSQAAQDKDLRGNWDKETAAGSSLNQAPAGSVSDETLLRLLENRRDQKNQEEAAGESRSEVTSDEKGAAATNRRTSIRKTQVLVKADPGDGLVKLSWKFANLPPKVDGQSLRFTIRYGSESEKPSKTLQVGTVDGYVLRDLKNNQPYYIQVLAGDR